MFDTFAVYIPGGAASVTLSQNDIILTIGGLFATWDYCIASVLLVSKTAKSFFRLRGRMEFSIIAFNRG